MFFSKSFLVAALAVLSSSTANAQKPFLRSDLAKESKPPQVTNGLLPDFTNGCRDGMECASGYCLDLACVNGACPCLPSTGLCFCSPESGGWCNVDEDCDGGSCPCTSPPCFCSPNPAPQNEMPTPAPTRPDYTFVGCYRDWRRRDLPHKVESAKNHESCFQSCRDNGYANFGLQYKAECWCGNSYGAYGETSCTNECSVDSTDFGAWKNCLYNITSVQYMFLGCWKDDTSARDLPHTTGSGKSHLQCFQECNDLGYDFFGLQHTGECWCGDSFGSHGSEECVNDCSVGATDFGDHRNCVYGINAADFDSNIVQDHVSIS